MTVGVPRTVMTRTYAGWYVTSPRACATVAVAHSTATSATVPSASRSRIGTPTARGDRRPLDGVALSALRRGLGEIDTDVVLHHHGRPVVVADAPRRRRWREADVRDDVEVGHRRR